MGTHVDELKSNLRKLRDKLALEAPRAHARQGTPPELDRRLQSTLQRTSNALSGPTGGAKPGALEELYDDIIVEAHLVLHEWERWQADAGAQKVKPPVATTNRRAHPRHDTNVSVQLLRHAVHASNHGVTLESESLKRPARNVSLGGMFVVLSKDDLPQVAAGSVVHISVSFGDSLTFRARAAVARRASDGIGLHWIQENEAVTRSIKALLDAIHQASR
jgi:hypothetical protein